MKKTAKKLLLSSLALVVTLALTVTSTYAWFNMNTEVETNFDVSITTDNGFQIFVAPYEYNTATSAITAPETSLTKAVYENKGYRTFIDQTNLGDLFTKHALMPSTVVRTGDVATADTDLSFVDIDGNAHIINPTESNANVFNVPYIKFRVYFRSSIARNISLANDAVEITKSGAAVEKTTTVSNLALFEQYIAATTDAQAYADWKAGTDKSEPFTVSNDNKNLTGTVTYANDNYVLSNATIKAADATNAYRIAFETKTAANEYNRFIFDKAPSTDAQALENLPASNIGWIHYNDGAANDAKFKKPITLEGTAANLVALEVVEGSVYYYGYTDVTIWLEGFDNDCFDSVSGMAANLKFSFVTTAA